MNITLHVFLVILSLLTTYTIIDGVRKNKLIESESFFWAIGSLIAFVLSLIPQILNWFANRVGVDYPPAILFLLCLLLIFLILFRQTVLITKLSERNKIIAQEIAIITEELETMKSEMNDKML